MDLQEFVRDALTQICAGVADAQNQVGSKGATVNPRLKYSSKAVHDPHSSHELDEENLKNVGLLATFQRDGYADVIEFDVALTVTSSKSESATVGAEGKVEGKILVASMDVNVRTENKRQNENSRSDVSRIKFRVPVQFPTR